MKSTAAGLPSDLQERLRFEELIADLSSRFINLPPAEVDHAIEDALRRVCELLAIDYAVLWQWSTLPPAVVTPTHVFPSEETLEPPSPLRQEQYPWIVQQMLAGRMVALSSLDELPAEAAVDKESGRDRGIKSNLSIPLSVGGAPHIGVLAFNTLRAERPWQDALVNRLQLAAQIFANALARKRSDVALRESEERLSLAADSAGAGLWILNLSTGVFWTTDEGRAMFGYAPGEAITMELFETSLHPEDLERVRAAIKQSARAGDPIDVEYRIVTPGAGGVRWIASRGRPRFASSPSA
jgi:formate hydrogenlyase transcriptional activator